MVAGVRRWNMADKRMGAADRLNVNRGGSDACFSAMRQTGAHESIIPWCPAWAGRSLWKHPGRLQGDCRPHGIKGSPRSRVTRPGATSSCIQKAQEFLETCRERFRCMSLAPCPDAGVTPPDGTPTAPLRGAPRWPHPSDQNSGIGSARRARLEVRLWISVRAHPGDRFIKMLRARSDGVKLPCSSRDAKAPRRRAAESVPPMSSIDG